MKQIIIATLLLGIVAALFCWKQDQVWERRTTELSALRDSLSQFQMQNARQEDSLWRYGLADNVYRLLLKNQLDSARVFTRVLDSLEGGERWASQLSASRLKRDSFSQALAELRNNINSAANRLQETEQLNGAALQEIRLQMDMQKQRAVAMAALEDSLDYWKNRQAQTEEQLEKLNNKYARLEFKGSAGLSIRYFGETLDGKAHGFGMGVVSNKGVYEGEWADNKRHGEGIYTWANGDRYEGQFAKGQKEGVGIYYFSSGERYEGAWKNDLREGSGRMYDKAGKILLNGEWKADKLVDKKPL